MSELLTRIERNIKAIAKAESMGRDTSAWQEHVMDLINQIYRSPLRVKLGRFGFCTCELSHGLCTGCWRMIKKCECKEVFVNPEEEATRKHAELMARLGKTKI